MIIMIKLYGNINRTKTPQTKKQLSFLEYLSEAKASTGNAISANALYNLINTSSEVESVTEGKKIEATETCGSCFTSFMATFVSKV